MRKNKNWIDSFIQYTEGKGSPRLYRLWSAIFTIGAACERKVYIITDRGKTYPNQYILLVGGAGIGKSLCTNTTHEFLMELRTPETPFHIAPTSVTRASLIDSLAASERRIIRPLENPAITSFHSLSIIPAEFGVFLPSWEGDFMASLTHLWDNGYYAETRRTSKLNIELPNTNLNILSATTPAQLNNLLPEGAWEFGFMSRMLIVYSGEVIRTKMFGGSGTDEKLRQDLIADLKEIYSLFGEMTITDDAQAAIDAWCMAGGPPIPSHPKLASYAPRRAHHLVKLCMIASIASDSDMIVTLDHYAEALDWLIQLETFMPDVFKSMRTGGDAIAMEECWHFVMQYWMKHNQPMPEDKVYKFLSERVPVHNIERLLEVMERGKLLIKRFTEAGGQGYEPKGRQAA